MFFIPFFSRSLTLVKTFLSIDILYTKLSMPLQSRMLTLPLQSNTGWSSSPGPSTGGSRRSFPHLSHSSSPSTIHSLGNGWASSPRESSLFRRDHSDNEDEDSHPHKRARVPINEILKDLKKDMKDMKK